MRSIGLLLLAAAGGACTAAPRPPDPRLWTVFDVQALYPSDGVIATGAGLGDGIPARRLLTAGGTELGVGESLAEGYHASYVTTEVWTYFDRVWLQPMYVPVTDAVDGAPHTVVDSAGHWHPIFGVGPGSGFYSPFWQIVYFQVPPGTAFDAITSLRAVIDGHYPLYPSGGRVAPLIPGDVTIATTTTTGGFSFGKGWLDGAEQPFVDFPASALRWDEAQVIEEVPLYHFFFRAPDGSLVPGGVPTVVGTGPPYSHTPPPVDAAGMPSGAYSAYWRIYKVVVPPGAKVFAPPGSKLYGMLPPVAVAPDSDYGPVVDDAVGRVALDPACFANDPDPSHAGCVYLDSQEKIETYVNPGDIEETAITATCPLVSFMNMAVAP